MSIGNAFLPPPVGARTSDQHPGAVLDFDFVNFGMWFERFVISSNRSPGAVERFANATYNPTWPTGASWPGASWFFMWSSSS